MQVLRPGLLVPLTLVVSAVAGCGGGDDVVSKKDYITKADAACAVANRQEVALKPGEVSWYLGPKFQDERWLSRFVAADRAALRGWQSVPLPDEARDEAKAALSAAQRMVGAMGAQVTALREGHPERTTANGIAYVTGWTDLVANGGQFGFQECLNLGT